jgi:hypothetical protein
MDQAPSGTGAFSVVIGRAVLSSGALIPRHVTGEAELVVLMDGEVEVAVHQGTMVWRQPHSRFVAIEDRQTISAGQTARANPGSVVEYRAGSDEPATLWIVTIA